MGGPIQPKSAGSVGTLGEMFGERIRANYEQIHNRIDPADILHFLAAPPECYIAETGMTTLVNHKNWTQLKNLELSLVNNVLNRILVCGHMAFTYQDRVFVENILKKLGVTDVREFIRQVQRIKEETGTVRELLALYESGRDTIRLIQEYRRKRPAQQGMPDAEENTGKAETGAETEGRLAAALLKRLRIDELYREVSRYAAFRPGSRTMIDRFELSYGEQRMAASYLALNECRSNIFMQNQNAVYDRPGQYEWWYVSRVGEDCGETADYFLQAALLHAIEQIFHIRYAEFTKTPGLWHEFMDALHVSVRNTFQRFEDLSTMRSFAIRDQEAFRQTVQQIERQEIDSLRNLFAISAWMTDNNAPFDMRAAQDGTTVFERRQDTNFDFMRTEVKHSEILRRENVQPQKALPQEVMKRSREREEEIRKQLTRIDRQNKERMERLAEYTERMKEVGSLRIDQEAAGDAGVRMIAGKEQAVPAERGMLHAVEKTQERERLRQILGDETMRVFETIRGYQKDPGRYPNVTVSQEQSMNLFLRDITAAGEKQEAGFEAGPDITLYDEVRHAVPKRAEHVSEKMAGGVRPGEYRQGRAAGQTEKPVELFHKQSSQIVNEERLQELLQSRNKGRDIQTTDVQKVFHEETQVTEIVQSKVNEMKVKQEEEIAYLISQNVKRQLDTLSEKVYGKLEKRMDAERRRRGV